MATRHSLLICACFAFMQAVTFALSGMKSEHSRIASGVQICSTLTGAAPGAAPWAPAWWRPQKSKAQTGNTSRQTKNVVRICPIPVLRKLLFRGETSGPAVDGPGEELRITGRPMAPGSMAAGSMKGPGKTPARARTVSGNVLGAALNATLDDFRRHVVKGHVPAKYPVRHGDDDIAGALGLPRIYRRLQDRVDRGMAADQQGRGEKHEKQRGNDDDAPGLGALLVHAGARAPPRQRGDADMIRLDEPCAGIPAHFLGCAHAGIEHRNPLNGR